ncbi:glycine receptor subunit alpha-3-like isoform X2 [Monomorium pharaonis]|uniref:glycine receptor subunit alpha-3-like isoform X2 n=1 Tax=Monomorium pharaonis TaxID=307658 RepID=UPI0017479515|nr:glycine receptor subunit alpha-3-like isoform X2 [Monomorium pharaonis]
MKLFLFIKGKIIMSSIYDRIEVQHLITLFFYDDRRTWLIYFSLKVGETLGYGYQKTCPKITVYLTWIGCIISGDPTVSSRMQKKLLFTRCQYQTIIFGYITTKRYFTCPRKRNIRFRLTLVLSCAMKFESYPHDTQICSMMIESLSHTTQDLVFLWNMTDPLVVNPEIELPQLDISNNYTTDCTIEYSTGNFTCIQIVFNLRRRLGYHLFHTYIPSALIVVMSWIAFWIKPEAIPARVTLGVTSLLTLATQNTQSQQSLPPVSYVKAIDVWMSSCSVFVFLSLMEFAVVNNYMGPIATKAMKGYSDEDLREDIDDFKTPMRSDAERSRSPTRPPMVQYEQCCEGRATAIYIDKVSRFFFPFSFFILNVVYWSTFL